MACRNGERADVIDVAALARRDIVRERELRLAALIIFLLAQRVQPRDLPLSRYVVKHHDIVTVAIRWEKSVDGMSRKQFFVDDFVEKFLRVGEQLARSRSPGRIAQQIRIAPAHFPSVEERRPIDKRGKIRKRKLLQHAAADEFRRGYTLLIPFGVQFVAY